MVDFKDMQGLVRLTVHDGKVYEGFLKEMRHDFTPHERAHADKFFNPPRAVSAEHMVMETTFTMCDVRQCGPDRQEVDFDTLRRVMRMIHVWEAAATDSAWERSMVGLADVSRFVKAVLGRHVNPFEMSRDEIIPRRFKGPGHGYRRPSPSPKPRPERIDLLSYVDARLSTIGRSKFVEDGIGRIGRAV